MRAGSALTCGSGSSPKLSSCERRPGLTAHAVDALDAILEYAQDGRDAFFADRKTQDAAIRNIQVLGQAVKGVSEQTRALDPEIPWRQIAGMRDKLIHEYVGVDLELVWDVVERDLPSLRPRIQALVDQVGP